MSVNTSEEYLDELLDAIEPIINPKQSDVQENPVMEVVQEQIETPVSNPEPEIVESPMDEAEIFTEEEPIQESVLYEESEAEQLDVVEDEAEGTATINDLLASLASEELETLDEDAMSQEDVESMLNSVSSQVMSENDETTYDEDVKELLKQFTGDEDLSDIQDILDKNDNGEALDNSMLDIPDVEVFQLEEDNDDEEENEKENKSSNPIGKLIGGFVGLFKKRKDRKKKEEDTTVSVEDESVIEEEEDNSEIMTEVDIDSVPGMEADVDLAEIDGMSLDDLFAGDVEELELDEDLSDIDQLLAGGTFTETDTISDNDVADDITESVSNKEAGKSKNTKDKKGKEKKKESIFSKIFNILTEEIDEPVKKKDAVPETGETVDTEENINILEERSAEDKKKAKKAKKEEKQNKKEKKNGKGGAKKGGADGDDDGKGGKNKKAQKTKKPKKKREKKEKLRKVEEISKPEKKLPKKRVWSTLVLCLSILAAILILQNVVSESDNIKEAQFAFDSGDYVTCFANLSTIERDEEQEALYQKSLIIMSVQRKWDSYNNFLMMNREVEALNSLLEGVTEYKKQEDLAIEWGVQGQITVIYQDIMEKLQGYGLTEADVEEILGYESKVTYTKRLDSIVNGTPFIIEDTVGSEAVSQPQPLQDILPGEEDFLPEDTTDIMSDDAVTVMSENIGSEADSSGETVIVGSNPVDISSQENNISYEEPVVTEGQNVGNGNTNLSTEVSGQNVVVGVR